MGLFHLEADLRLARENREREPIKGALALLEAEEADPLANACKALCAVSCLRRLSRVIAPLLL